jgi:Zn-dependent M28 family amino/carboxypeptidase
MRFASSIALCLLLVAPLAAERPAPRLDGGAMLADLKALSDPAMEGRAMGSPGLAKARALVIARMKAIGLAPVGEGFEHPFEAQGRPGVNVAGQLRGTRFPDRVLVMSAHLDHLGIRGGKVYPGADDDASGVAAVLGAAAYLKAHPPAHTVLFLLFDGEEADLLGSKAFVAKPPLPLARIRFDLSLDMVSRNDAGELWACGLRHWPKLKPAVEAAAGRSALKLRAGHDGGDRLEDWTLSSDHGSFHQKGIPFLYLGVEDHPDYHRSTDTFERIQPDFFQRAAETALDLFLEVDRHDEWVTP